ncbi:LysR family transcriptional regulator [Rathayibacter festucae]|uniref:LysR family transcriptional regulator n=1 Tax=Rathayibacter festucae TaxID=110937 RepID=UPI002A6A5C99|nr:LysR family transcriptional regulator [Rathayibacter festucae]MDY0913455.1 LysR family transcriptional regulator [Rathayibacter festucae]
MLDVQRLRVLRAVVAAGSIVGAASSLGYTPSAISQHLAALQRETGLTLLERVGRGVRPTAAGRTLAEQADRVLERLGEAEAVVADLRAGRAGRLSMTYFASVGSAWMPEVARRLIAGFPQLALDLRLGEEVAEDPAERPDVQLLVAEPGGSADSPGFVAHHLIDDPYLAVLSHSHPLAGRAEIELAEIAGDRWIDNDLPTGWCRRTLVDACAAAGFTPRFHVQANDHVTAVAFVAAGMGLTVLPALAAQVLPPGLVAVPLVRPRPLRSIHAVVRGSVASSAPVRVAVSALVELAGADSGR